MKPKPITKADWTTDSGYRAIVLYVNDSHHCGYVEVPRTHPLYGLDYDSKLPNYTDSDHIPPRLDDIIDVHGGLTFSGSGTEGYPANTDGWWFGFDCAHLGDLTRLDSELNISFDTTATFKDVPYVKAECERLAAQLKAPEHERTKEQTHD